MISLERLLTAPQDLIQSEEIAEFLRALVPESRLHDYKQTVSAALKTIAAFANTSGGVVVIGIEDKTNRVVGIPATAATDLSNTCWAQLDPPFSPEIIPFRIDSKKILLVRVHLEDVRRPVFVNGTVHFRIGDTTQPADRSYVEALFNEVSRANRAIGSANVSAFNLASKEGCLTVRNIVGTDLPHRLRHSMWIGTPLRLAVVDALNSSPASEWLRRADPKRQWAIAGHNTSLAATWRWRGEDERTPATGEARLELTGMPQPWQAVLWLDLTIRPGDTTLPLNDFYWLLHSAISTCTRVLGPTAFNALLREPWIGVGPTCLVDSDQMPLQDVVDFMETGFVSDYAAHGTRAQLAPSTRWPTTDDDIHSQVLDWLTRVALDCNLMGAEASIDRLPL